MINFKKNQISNLIDYFNYIILIFIFFRSIKNGMDFPNGKLSYFYYIILSVFLLLTLIRKKIALFFKSDVITIILIIQVIFSISLIFITIKMIV